MSEAFVNVIKVLASLSALYMCLSPSTSMYRIHKQRATGPSSIVPLVALWGCNHMWMLYGYVTDNIFPLMVTYIVGDVTSVVFIAVFYRYTTDKRRAVQVCVATLVVNALVTFYALLGRSGALHQSRDAVNLIVGIIAIASSIVLYASPFATIKHVITSKSSESIPFAMVSVGIANNVLWIIYGYFIRDALLVIPTAVNTVIGVVQFVLYFVYRPKRHKSGAPVASGVAGGVGGEIEIVADEPRLTQPPALPVSIEASGLVAEKSHVTQTTVPQNGELSLSAAQLEAEAGYVEMMTPRHEVILVADESHVEQTTVPQNGELSLSAAQLEAEAGYLEVKTPRHEVILVADESHVEQTSTPHVGELSLSAIHLEAEASYVEVKTPHHEVIFVAGEKSHVAQTSVPPNGEHSVSAAQLEAQVKTSSRSSYAVVA